MKWIKHDTDANQDAKLQNVLLDYGLEGYGLYWYCIELIAGKVSEDNITFELEHDARVIARNTGCTVQKVEEMMRYFVEIGLFEHSNNTITCLKLAKRLNKSMTSSSQMREIIGKLKGHDSVMIKSDKIMQEENRIEENRIEKNKYSGKQSLPPCPQQEILKAWSEVMPDKTQPRTWDGVRATNLRARWNDCFSITRTDGKGFLYTDKDTGINFWRAFFQFMRKSQFLMNECRPFGLDWIVKKANFEKILEHKYHG